LPVFCSDPLLVQRGVLGAVGYDYETLGREAGSMIAKILTGQSIQMIPIQAPQARKTEINLQLVERLKKQQQRSSGEPR
jgi:putative ABC transport system substrate-binding protein